MRFSYFPAFGIFLIALSLVVACQRSETKSTAPAQPPKVDTGSASGKSNAGSVTEQQAKVFADQWVEAVVNGDSRTANELIGWREILTNAVDSFSIKQKTKTSLIESNLRSASQISNEISKELIEGGDYRLVNINQRSGDSFALFRLINSDESFNYHLIRLRKVRDRVRGDQFFVAITGEEMADTFRTLFAPAIASMGLAGKLSGKQKEYNDAMEQLAAMKAAVDSGKLNRALKIYDQLPESVKYTKVAMIQRITATSIENERAYQIVVDEFLEAFPGDSAGGMMTLEAGCVRNDPKLIKQGYQTLNEWTGGDPYLDLMVGANLANFGELEQAIQLTNSIDPATTGVGSSHAFKMTIAMEAEDHDETLKQLRALSNVYGYEFSDLRKVPDFAKFVDSPQFEQWQAETGR